MTDTDLDRLLRSADPAAYLTAPAPPPLPDTVVESRARRNRWLPATGAAAAVVAVVGLAVASTHDTGGIRAASPGVAVTTVVAPAGPAQRLLPALQKMLPAGFGVRVSAQQPPPGPPGETDRAYDVSFDVLDGTRTGTVTVTSWTGLPPGDPCALSAKLARQAGTCRIVQTSTGARVGVSEADPFPRRRPLEWALHQHPDGTVVLLTQVYSTYRQPIWSAARLAEVATAATFAR